MTGRTRIRVVYCPWCQVQPCAFTHTRTACSCSDSPHPFIQGRHEQPLRRQQLVRPDTPIKAVAALAWKAPTAGTRPHTEPVLGAPAHSALGLGSGASRPSVQRPAVRGASDSEPGSEASALGGAGGLRTGWWGAGAVLGVLPGSLQVEGRL